MKLCLFLFASLVFAADWEAVQRIAAQRIEVRPYFLAIEIRRRIGGSTSARTRSPSPTGPRIHLSRRIGRSTFSCATRT